MSLSIARFHRLGQYDWLPIFVLFVAVRVLSASPYYQLEADGTTHLTLARHFPWHTLYNRDLYLIHPPLFHYSVGILAKLLPLVQAGLLASLTFACFNFFVLKKLARCFGLGRIGILI